MQAIPEIRGGIESQPTVYTKSDRIRANVKNCRSITFINAGAITAFLYGPKVNLPILPGGSFTLGGYWDRNRSEDIELIFGAGVAKLIVIRDMEREETIWK